MGEKEGWGGVVRRMGLGGGFAGEMVDARGGGEMGDARGGGAMGGGRLGGEWRGMEVVEKRL